MNANQEIELIDNLAKASSSDTNQNENISESWKLNNFIKLDKKLKCK